MVAVERTHGGANGAASRLRESRRRRGLSQEELARLVGVSRSAVAQWETGRAGQLGVHLARIARALEVDAGWLLQGGVADEAQALGGDELALLRLYRLCSPDDRQMALRMVRRLAHDRTAAQSAELFTES